MNAYAQYDTTLGVLVMSGDTSSMTVIPIVIGTFVYSLSLQAVCPFISVSESLKSVDDKVIRWANTP